MMIESAAPKYTMFNPENANCPVCAGLNSIYRRNSFQNELELPEAAGKGYYRRIIVKPSMEITISDMTFYERVTMAGGPDHHIYGLAFCLGEAFRWRVEGNKQEYEIEGEENYIFNGNRGNSICSYVPGQRFWGLSIQLDSETIASLLRHLGKERSRTGLSYGSNLFYKRRFSSAVKRILHEIINCRYRDDVKRIYLEGKILELIAVYLDEAILEDRGRNSIARFSAYDREALHTARRILDENITAPPGIGKLARQVCLNEYKLKTGFKELFGMSVHAYVIDKRLELARVLLEEQKLGVTEAVLLVGYSDASHFAEKFRKKYGANPSEYTREWDESRKRGEL